MWETQKPLWLTLVFLVEQKVVEPLGLGGGGALLWLKLGTEIHASAQQILLHVPVVSSRRVLMSLHMPMPSCVQSCCWCRRASECQGLHPGEVRGPC